MSWFDFPRDGLEWTGQGGDAHMTKIKVDAAKVLSDLAISQTQQMGEFRMALRAHRDWDRKMVRQARQLGIEFEDPPELFLSHEGLPGLNITGAIFAL
ncbi:hypothetical protein [Nocardia sp. NPDC057440]|uniref:hypothetical protein n=1 Tax=Nocardia sp. NPDC057440 TaxID=3346134 RepID=UPI00366BAC78